jgi:hypothetical protein
MKTTAREKLIEDIIKEMPPSFKDEYVKEYYLEGFALRGLRKELAHIRTANKRLVKQENSEFPNNQGERDGNR